MAEEKGVKVSANSTGLVGDNICNVVATDGAIQDVCGTRVHRSLTDSYGGQLNLKHTTQWVDLKSGSSSHVPDMVPDGAALMGAIAEVETAIAGITTWKFGTVADTDAFGASLSSVVGTVVDSTNFTANPFSLTFPTASAMGLVIGATSGTFSAGRVRLTAFYAESEQA